MLPKVVGCTLGTSLMRLLRGNSWSSSRVTKCKSDWTTVSERVTSISLLFSIYLISIRACHGKLADRSCYSETTSIPVNPRTTRPVGYAFVDLETAEEAEKAIANLSGKEILERKVSVQVARKPDAGDAAPGTNAAEPTSGGEGRKRGTGRGRGRGRGRGGRSARGGRAVRSEPYSV